MKTREVIAAAAGKLRGAGVPEPENDAWLLFSESFGMSRTDYLLHAEEEFYPAPDRERLFIERLARRQRRIPLQRILGVQNFCGLDLYVDERVLIPRQDTEILVELVLQEHGKPALKSGTHSTEMPEGEKILDLCTGSGCIAIALAKLGRFSAVSAADISADALAVAEENLKRTGAEVTLIHSDLFSEIPGKFDVITANPPYIQSEVIDTLTPEVREHEPRLALDGDEDGLVFYRRLASECPAHLNPGGSVYFEIGYDQGEAVRKLLLEHGFKNIEVLQDLAGLDRVVRAEYSGNS